LPKNLDVQKLIVFE